MTNDLDHTGQDLQTRGDLVETEPEQVAVNGESVPAPESAVEEEPAQQPATADHEARPFGHRLRRVVGKGLARGSAGARRRTPRGGRASRRRWLAGLLVSLAALIAVGALFWRYLRHPEPLPDLLPAASSLDYAPHYLFSIHDVDRPVGVALSPAADRIYVTETTGERLVKVFDREGSLLAAFAPPSTTPAQRSPVYVATDSTGRVWVTDRLQRTIFVYSPDGSLLDAILGPNLTLSSYVAEHTDGAASGMAMAYNLLGSLVVYQKSGGDVETLPLPNLTAWAPLGIRFDRAGDLLLTDVYAEQHRVRQIPASVLSGDHLQSFDPPDLSFGAYGQKNGEFMFPNAAVRDSLDRVCVSDGNNGRIGVWDAGGEFLFSFGQGAAEGSLRLPRGAAIDQRDRLHVVDAVEQNVKVYAMSGAAPEFLYSFGNWGAGDGEFNFPNDIALDATGRVYVADRANNRVQVWSY